MKKLFATKFDKRTTVMIAAVMAGSMAFVSGCGAADKTAEVQSDEAIIQEESSLTKESSMQAQTEMETQTTAETETQTTAETQMQTDVETQTEAETQTELQKAEAETEKESEAHSEKQAEAETESAPQEQTSEVQKAAPAAEGSVSASDFAAIVKGITIPLKGDMSAYTPQLGEPDEFGSARSCVEAGDDKVYTYGGVVIYTYITNGIDVISLIEITGSEALPSEIHIGSTKADVIAAYGSAYTEEGTELLYELGDMTIGLQMSGDTVSFIEIF